MMKSLLFTILTLVGLIILVELILRASGGYFYYTNIYENRVQSSHSNSFKILTLGESTTVSTKKNGVDISWPAQLERKLRSKKFNVKVYNEGHSGTTTVHILNNLENYLSYYKPDLVISMMGVNDTKHLHYKKLKNPWMNFKIIKVYRWFKSYFKSKSRVYMNENDKKILSVTLRDIKKGTRTLDEILNNNLSKVFAKLDFLIQLFWTSYPANPQNPRINEVELSSKISQKTLGLYPNSPLSLNAYLAVTTLDQNIKRCKLAGFNFLEQGHVLSSEGFVRLSYCLKSKEDFHRLYKFYPNILFDKNKPYNPHLNLYSALYEKGIPLFLLSYPTRDIGNIKAQFINIKRSHGLRFIENKSNFEQALKVHPYEYLFSDRFASEWGHATEYGNKLIVERLLPVVIKKINKEAK